MILTTSPCVGAGKRTIVAGGCCKKNNKKMAHNFCVEGMAKGLQLTVVTAGYIRPTAKFETEKAYLVAQGKGIRPLDLSFDPDPKPAAISQLPLHYPLPRSLSP